MQEYYMLFQGRIQDFKLGGGALKKIPPSGGRCENFGGISCEKSRFYAKKIIFFPIAEGGAKTFGVFRVKNHDFTPNNLIFSNFRGAHPCAPPPPPHLDPSLYSASSQRMWVYIPCLFSISPEPISNTRMFSYFVYCILIIVYLLQGSVMEQPLIEHRPCLSMT